MGRYLKDLMEERNCDARLYRVQDDDLHIWANKFETANDFLEDILALPIANTSTLKKSDMIILGCPTLFGNVTAEMKAFLDTTYEMSETRELESKFFACFTSCTHSTCEGAHAIDSMLLWAQNMGLIHIPFGVHTDIDFDNQPVAGIVHLEGEESMIRPSERLGNVMTCYADNLAAYIQEDEQQ
jgi:NAD(P)H dehydrogenase (quinone)